MVSLLWCGLFVLTPLIIHNRVNESTWLTLMVCHGGGRGECGRVWPAREDWGNNQLRSRGCRGVSRSGLR